MRLASETTTSKLFQISETGSRIFSKQKLKNNGYPTEPSREYYLVYKIQKVRDAEFENRNWDITKLKAYKTNKVLGLPFSATITDLMNSIVKD